jgi:hypothetical protein
MPFFALIIFQVVSQIFAWGHFWTLICLSMFPK